MTTLKLVLATILIASITLGFGAWLLESQKDKLIDDTYIEHSNAIDSFNIQDFKEELYKQNIKCPEAVLRQAVLESGWFTSNIWIKNNNPFGFYYKGDYLEFKHWIYAVEYYSKWQTRHYRGGNYYEFLQKVGYASDSCYVEKLKQIDLNRIK